MQKQAVYLQTPVFESQRLNRLIDKQVHFKMECFQPTQSFKIRGMAHLCAARIAEGCKEFITSSGGNAGYSLAYAGLKLGASVKVIVPETTGALMRERIRDLGAEVEIHGSVWDEAHAYASKLAAQTGASYVSPFDDPLLWEGHATMIDECASQMPEPDVVLVAVGGGGLMCGVLEGMERNSWKRAQVIAAETDGAASYAAALKAGKVVELKAITSIAKSLGAKAVSQTALDWAQKRKIRSFVCTDRETMQAARQFADDFKALVEPACGAALAGVYVQPHVLLDAKRVLVIACGGAGVDLQQFQNWE